MNKLQSIFSNEGLTKEQESELGKLGWHIINDGAYLDIQYEETYLEESTNNYRHSMNVQFTVDYENKGYYLVLGNNEGSGFNSFADINLENTNILESFDEMLNKFINDSQNKSRLSGLDSLSLIKKHPEHIESIRTGAIADLEKWLKT